MNRLTLAFLFFVIISPAILAAQDGSRPASKASVRRVKMSISCGVFSLPPGGNPELELNLLGKTGPDDRDGWEIPSGLWCVVAPLPGALDESNINKFFEETNKNNADGLVLSAAQILTDDNLPKLLECKNLSMIALGSVGLGDDALAKLATLPKLRSLSFQARKNLARGLPFLREMKQLTDLGLSGTNVADGDLPEIAKLAELRSLDLSGCKITNAGLQQLTPLANLERLYIDYTNIDDGAGAAIASFTKLRHLNCLSTPAGDGVIKSLAKCAALESFGTGVRSNVTNVSDDGLAVLASLPHLKHLAFIGYTTFSNHSCEILSHASALETLVLNGLTRMQFAGPFNLGRLGGLKTIDANFVAITDVGASYLSKIKTLKNISLGGYREITDNVFNSFATLPNLESIDLSGTRVTGGNFHKLSGAKHLKVIYLGSTEFGDEGAAALAEHAELTRIYAGTTKLTDAGLKAFANLKKLEVLGVGNNSVTNEGAKALAECASLQSLLIYGTKVDVECAKYLKSKLPNLDIQLR
ncbi:MAG: hypothetical protein HY286_02710 [Planctomycetes bacterium]|nr:hypothetical protein [Planctomycetota bacterium]